VYFYTLDKFTTTIGRHFQGKSFGSNLVVSHVAAVVINIICMPATFKKHLITADQN